jgi:hypothetical protein
VTVGATQPTGFGDAFGADELTVALDRWFAHGQMQRRMMPADELAAVLYGTLRGALAAPSVGLERLRLRAPAGPARSWDEYEG